MRVRRARHSPSPGLLGGSVRALLLVRVGTSARRGGSSLRVRAKATGAQVRDRIEASALHLAVRERQAATHRVHRAIGLDAAKEMHLRRGSRIHRAGPVSSAASHVRRTRVFQIVRQAAHVRTEEPVRKAASGSTASSTRRATGRNGLIRRIGLRAQKAAKRGSRLEILPSVSLAASLRASRADLAGRAVASRAGLQARSRFRSRRISLSVASRAARLRSLPTTRSRLASVRRHASSSPAKVSQPDERYDCKAQ